MPNIILVMLGGAIGSGGRYAVGQLAARHFPGFPWGTLIVNLAGGLLMGLLAGTLAREGHMQNPLVLFLGAGVLGGFTTFSAFSLDAVSLVQRGANAAALAYVLASVAGALALFAAGYALFKAAA